MADRIGFQQVILNLLINSIEATGGMEDLPRDVLVSSNNEALVGVLISVQDFGTRNRTI